MDPNANLKEQLRIVEQLREADHACDEAQVMVLSSRLCDLVVALDSWIRSGGFLPADWQKGQSR